MGLSRKVAGNSVLPPWFTIIVIMAIVSWRQRFADRPGWIGVMYLLESVDLSTR